ncbi:Ribosomal protein S14p/S29e family protein [Prunus dulcis]|uniref:Ribosomal protein S14p/S29e family protein n=1 Tax=Prunus dulcis TaxID=3755 RepID=A0A4Y1QTG3_PRUDU|nr:Ribosomal protein S14p/S29e family protein [Prunus dulcis]
MALQRQRSELKAAFQDDRARIKMGHSNVWNSHPKNYGPGSHFLVKDMSYVENLFVTLDSRVCGNPHGLIRKYALMCCRQCFRSNAKEIGFIKIIVTCRLMQEE